MWSASLGRGKSQLAVLVICKIHFKLYQTIYFLFPTPFSFVFYLSSMLSIRNLSFSVGPARLLEGVSLDVAKGGYTVIVGQNGAGKTTILKCLARIFDSWKGEILLEGNSIRSIPRKAAARRIAFVQQSLAIPFAFTVRQIVEMGRYPYLSPLAPISKREREIADSAMQEIGITEFSERTMETLSGGERQKVMLAAAITQQPEMLLLDEPTTYLDYRHQAEIGSVLRKINRRGTTILEVTHDINRAVLDGQHVIAIGKGKVVFDGRPDVFMRPETLRGIYGIDFELVDHPNHPLKMIVPGL